MSLLDTLLEARTLHAYALAVSLALAFNAVGLIGLVQLLGVTLFFGFAALLDELAGLRRSIESVDSQLAEVNDQLDRVNAAEQGQTEDQERNQ